METNNKKSQPRIFTFLRPASGPPASGGGSSSSSSSVPGLKAAPDGKAQFEPAAIPTAKTSIDAHIQIPAQNVTLEAKQKNIVLLKKQSTENRVQGNLLCVAKEWGAAMDCYHHAIVIYRYMLNIYTQIPPQDLTAENRADQLTTQRNIGFCLSQLGNIFHEQGAYTKAVILSATSLKTYAEIPQQHITNEDKENQLNLRKNIVICRIKLYLGDSLAKIPIQGTYEDIHKQIFDLYDNGLRLNKVAEELHAQRDLKQACLGYESARDSFKTAFGLLVQLPPIDTNNDKKIRINLPKGLARSEQNRGILLWELKQYDKAIDAYTASIITSAQLLDVAMIKLQIGSLYRRGAARMNFVNKDTIEPREKVNAICTAVIEDLDAAFALFGQIPMLDIEVHNRERQIEILRILTECQLLYSTLLFKQGDNRWMRETQTAVIMFREMKQEYDQACKINLHTPFREVLEKDTTPAGRRALYNFNGDISPFFPIERCSEAKDYYTRSLQIAEAAEIYYSRGCVNRRLGAFKEAADDLKKAIALQQKDVRIKYKIALANVHWDEGQFVTALEEKNDLLQDPRIDSMTASRLRQSLVACAFIRGPAPNMEELRGFILRNTLLEAINFQNFSISDATAQQLANTLRERQEKGSSIGLMLKNCVVSTGAIVLLAGTIGKLALRGIPLDDAAVTMMADFLRTCRTLWHLDLKECGISARGAALLADALKVNKTLTTLDLAAPADVKDAIAECIKRNKIIFAKTLIATRTFVPALSLARANARGAFSLIQANLRSAFSVVRANPRSELVKRSITSILPTIFNFWKPVGDSTNKLDLKWNIEGFMKTKYFKAETSVGAKPSGPG